MAHPNSEADVSLELLLGRTLLAKGLGEIIPEGRRTRYSNRVFHFFGGLIFFFLFMMYWVTVVAFYPVQISFAMSVLIFAIAFLLEALIHMVFKKGTLEESLFRRHFVHRVNIVFVATLTALYTALIALRVPLADPIYLFQPTTLLIGYLLLRFAFRQDSLRWDSFDSVVESIQTFFRQVSGTLTRWIVLVTQAIVVTLIITLISEELWLIVGQLQLSRLLGVCGILVLTAFIFGYARVARLIGVVLSELTPVDDFDPVPSVLPLLLDEHERTTNSFKVSFRRALAGTLFTTASPAAAYYRELVQLREQSRWKYNGYTVRGIRPLLENDYSVRAGIALVLSSMLIGFFSFCVLSLFLIVTLPEGAIVEWTGANNSSLATAIRADESLPEVVAQLAVFDWSALFQEPIPRMALLGTSLMVSLLLLDAGSQRASILRLLALTDELIVQHFSLSLMYRWSIEPNYQLIGSIPLKLRTRMGPVELSCPCVLVVNVPTDDEMGQVAQELAEHNLSMVAYYGVIFMDEPAFTQLVLKRYLTPIGKMENRLSDLQVGDLDTKGRFWLWRNTTRTTLPMSDADDIWNHLASVLNAD